MGLYDEHHEFSPILIPISTRMDELRVTYRIYMQSGEVHEVRGFPEREKSAPLPR